MERESAELKKKIADRVIKFSSRFSDTEKKMKYIAELGVTKAAELEESLQSTKAALTVFSSSSAAIKDLVDANTMLSKRLRTISEKSNKRIGDLMIIPANGADRAGIAMHSWIENLDRISNWAKEMLDKLDEKGKLVLTKGSHFFNNLGLLMKDCALVLSLLAGFLQMIEAKRPAPPLTGPATQQYIDPAEFLQSGRWRTYDIYNDEEAAAISKFLKESLVSNGLNNNEYSKEFLQWDLCPPGFKQKWHIGIEEPNSKRLIGFIAAVPAKLRLSKLRSFKQDLEVAEIKFVAVQKEQRLQELGPILIRKISEDASPFPVCYAVPDLNQLPFANVRCWTRKLIDVEKELEINSLSTSSPINGLREMEAGDVRSVTVLLRSYLERFDVAATFDESEVDHWFRPRPDLAYTYVVESSGKITDLISFFSVPFSIPGVNDTNLRSAYSFYNVSTTVPRAELVKAAVVIAKSKGIDTFNILDVMENHSMLESLSFNIRLGQAYSLQYEYPFKSELLSGKIGLVMY